MTFVGWIGGDAIGGWVAGFASLLGAGAVGEEEVLEWTKDSLNCERGENCI